MRGAARAIGWEFRWRHRLWLIALGAYVIVFFAIKLLILGPGHPIRMNPPNGLAGFIIAPVSWTFFYFVAVFSYGLSGDLAARESIFPARMFTLPVTTRATKISSSDGTRSPTRCDSLMSFSGALRTILPWLIIVT